MLDIKQRIKNLFGFDRPKSAKLVKGRITRVVSSRVAISEGGPVPVPKRGFTRQGDIVYIPTGSFPFPFALDRYQERVFDPTPTPITPEPFVGGGGASGGAGATGGWDSSPSSDSTSSPSISSGGGGGE